MPRRLPSAAPAPGGGKHSAYRCQVLCRPTSSPTKISLSALLAASPRDSLLSSTLGKKRMLSAQSSPSPAGGSTPGNNLGFSGFQGTGDGSNSGGGGHASSSALTSSLTGGLRCLILPQSPCHVAPCLLPTAASLS